MGRLTGMGLKIGGVDISGQALVRAGIVCGRDSHHGEVIGGRAY